ncbi:MAG: DUF4082 domain-containing protein, partial [Micrococcales bacterium]|nr:DUF4082 domain-containing protein [Micrococcales bacterium]
MVLKKFLVSLSAIILLSNLGPVSQSNALTDGARSCSGGGSFQITNNRVVSASSCSGTAVIPNGVTSIGAGAFANNGGLTRVILPSSVTSIGTSAFDSTGISQISLPNNLTSIGSYAFFYTNITNLVIPSSVTSLGWYTLGYMPSLVRIQFKGSAPSYLSIAFRANNADLKVTYPCGASGYSALTMSKSVWGCPVHFDSKGGTSVEDTTFDEGGYMGLPANDPIRAGYTFAGWSTTDGGSVIDLPYSPSGSQAITLYAKWSADSHTVTFNSKGGTDVSAGSFVTDGSITAPSAPTRSGYTFQGWSASDGGSAVDFPYSPGATTDFTLYAKWSADGHTVTFDSKGGSAVPSGSFVTGGSIFNSYHLLDGSTIPENSFQSPLELGLKMSSSADGWVRKVTFYKYAGDNSVHTANVWSSTGILLASQNFADETESGWQSVTLNNPVRIDANQSFTVSVFSDAYRFNGSFTNSLPSRTSGPLTIIDGFYRYTNVSAYPNQTVNLQYNVNLEFAFVPYDPTRAGYTFQGWSATDGGEAVSFPYSPVTDVTLYAKWSADGHTVTFNSKGGSVVSAGSFVTAGSLTAPTPPTRSGYTFQGWSASDGGSAVSFPYSPGVVTDVTLYAKWSANSFTVTFDSNCDQYVSPGSFVFDGSIAEPVAPRLTDYTFLGWSATNGGDLISFPYFPGVASNIVLYAKWANKSFTVNYVSNGGSSVDSGSVLYHGSIVAPSAPTRAGYIFQGWSATNGGSAVSFPYSPGVVSNVTLYAKW